MAFEEMECISANGFNLFYAQSGSGQNLILLHGFPTNSYIWRNIIPHLSTKFRVVAPDLLGYGKSDMPLEEGTNLQLQSEMIISIMDKLSIEKAIICGHDIGGGVAQIIATTHKKRVEKLVLIDSVSYDSWPIQQVKKWQDPSLEQAITPSELSAQLKELISQGFYDESKVTNELINNFIEPWLSPEGVLAFLNNVRSMDPKYTMVVIEELKTLKIPVLLIWGEADVFQNSEYAYRLLGDIPECRLEIVPNAGHFVMEDNPEQVSSLIADFASEALLAA